MVFERFGRIADAFSSPKRLGLSSVQAHGEGDVDSLVKQVAMAVANTSRHLQLQKMAEWWNPAAKEQGSFIAWQKADLPVKTETVIS